MFINEWGNGKFFNICNNSPISVNKVIRSNIGKLYVAFPIFRVWILPDKMENDSLPKISYRIA